MVIRRSSLSSKSMTIKDIAQLAGVSIATVSKVLNNKDHDISDETRAKITKIISEHNYIPYRQVVERMSVKTDTIGLMIMDRMNSFSKEFIRGVEDASYQAEISVITYNTDGDSSKEQKCFEILQERNVDGILFVPSVNEENNELVYSVEEDLPVVIIGQTKGEVDNSKISLDYKQGVYEAVVSLLKRSHKRIGYICGSLSTLIEAEKLEGYKKALYDHNVAYDNKLIFESASTNGKTGGYEGGNHLLSLGVTAIVTSNDLIACGVYMAAQERSVHIPDDLSVIGFGNTDICDLILPSLSSVAYPLYDMGYAAAVALISRIRRHDEPDLGSYEPTLVLRSSVAEAPSLDLVPKERIVIVGSLNMDIIMRVPHIPKVGETIFARGIKSAAGGKGANQAVGAGKLGGKVHMIGRVGSDMYGRELYNGLLKSGVDASGVVFDDMLPTGNAYIHVSDNGDNSIVVNPGANSRLSREQVQEYEWIFGQVTYCLVQMEIPAETISYVAEVCRRNEVKLIVKPAPAHHFKPQQIRDCFLIVPNETELDLLIPGEYSIEEKAYQLLEMNCEHVIVTLGERGCLLINKDTKQYFAAADFNAVDTTAASDSFISGLTVALAAGKPMAEAIRFGILAAGITVSREGAQPSLPDDETMRIYM